MPSHPRFLTVSQVTRKIKGLLELEVGEVWIRGEVSGARPSAAGHVYFGLKDEFSLLSCALFRDRAARAATRRQASGASDQTGNPKFEIRDGIEVIVHGRISVYAPRGSYQLIVDHVEPVGAGALTAAFEQLKTRLQKEGLFDPARKRAIPSHPSKVAIVTSPTGAALQDFLNVIGRRHAGISVLVVPALVQGEEAPEQIARGIATVDRFALADVIVVARGGGSIEDLWGFNDERVVRAVAGSRIPVISAVGHEVDFTLCDFAADLRAPTPSAAAELVSRSRLELLEGLSASHRRLALVMSARIDRCRSSLLALENVMISPSDRLALWRRRFKELELRMVHAAERSSSTKRRGLESLSGRLEALSPLKVLGRGYTLIRDTASGAVVKSASEAKPGREIDVIFHDGEASAKIL